MTPKSSRLAGMVAVAAALIILFARPIGDLARLSFSSDLYSYIPMVPLISVFLIWTGRRALPSGFIPAPRLALIPLSTGLLFLASYGWARSGGWKPELSDYLALIDRKSTRLNSSHLGISYAVFCLKKKKTTAAICE